MTAKKTPPIDVWNYLREEGYADANSIVCPNHRYYLSVNFKAHDPSVAGQLKRDDFGKLVHLCAEIIADKHRGVSDSVDLLLWNLALKVAEKYEIKPRIETKRRITTLWYPTSALTTDEVDRFVQIVRRYDLLSVSSEKTEAIATIDNGLENAIERLMISEE